MTAPDLDFLPPSGEFREVISGTITPSYSLVSLRPGIHTIQVTWDGTAAIQIRRSPSRIWSTTKVIGMIPAGTGPRSTVIPGIAVGGENCYIMLSLVAGILTDGERGSIVDTSIPLQ